MRRLSRTVLLVATASITGVLPASHLSADSYEPVRRYLDNGYIDRASSLIEHLLDEDSADVGAWFYSSKLEKRGEISVERLQKGLELCGEECGEIVCDLADAYYVWGRYRDVILLFDRFRNKVDARPETLKFFWFAGLSYVRLGQYRAADSVFERMEELNGRDDFPLWGRLGRGSARATGGKIESAMSVLGSLSTAPNEVAALATYNRALLAARSGDDDGALFGYDILYQQYGDFLGGADLRAAILDVRSGRTEGEIEQLVDVTYTIEMGVFRDKSEADRLVGKLKAGGWSVDTKTTTAADRVYWVVRVGAFRSQQAAHETKEKLEDLFPGSYRVVIR